MKDRKSDEILSVVALRLMSASEITQNVREHGDERSLSLIKYDLDQAIVRVQIALEQLNSYRDSLDTPTIKED